MSAQTRSHKDRFLDGAPFALCILMSMGFPLTLIAVAGLRKGLLIYAVACLVLLPVIAFGPGFVFGLPSKPPRTMASSSRSAQTSQERDVA